MKILFLTDNFPPEINAPASRTIEHAKEWVSKGACVTVITCAPNFPDGKIFAGYKNQLYQREMISGINVIRVWSYISSNKGFFKRILDYLSFAVASFIAGLFIKTDVIVATSPQFFTTWSGWALSKIKRRPWVFELRDLWPESIRAVGAMKRSKFLDILEKIELGLYGSANAIVCLTNSFKNNLIKRGIDSKKIFIVTNGANLELFKPKEKNEFLLDSLKLRNKFVIGYIGTHGMAHGLDFIIRCIQKISDSNIHFLFIGSGATKKDIVNLANDLKISNVTFMDPVPKKIITDYFSIVDVALVPLIKNDTFKTVIPSKIFEASAMLKPILLGVEGESKFMIDKYKAGLCFEPENEGDFLEKVKSIKQNYNIYIDGCSKLANDFERKKLANDMLNILVDVKNGAKK